jgi:ribosome-associated toxin RatA of RatAB toxin-antitoxin module
MPKIEMRTTIKAPLDKVVEIARDVERYPEFMPDVRGVRILETSVDGNTQRVEWIGYIKQFAREIKWVQEDRWVTPSRVEYAQIQGDYDRMQGYWEFRDAGGDTEFTSVFDYEYKVPLVGALLAKVVDFVVRQNLNSVMAGIQKRAEG